MSLISWHRLLLLIVPLGLMSLGCLGAYLAHAQGDPEESFGVVINVDGIINGVKHRYISRSIEEAQGTGADLLVIELDTPGGLVDSTRDIVAVLLESPVPVAVYVSPPRRPGRLRRDLYHRGGSRCGNGSGNQHRCGHAGVGHG